MNFRMTVPISSSGLCCLKEAAAELETEGGLQQPAHCMQIQGKDRAAVAEAGRRLGLDGTYIARSYIEQVTSLPHFSPCHPT